ncbi:MAG: hypothetical protein WBO10_15505 [Pyrinomonadaceae bacterium]
MKFHQYRANRVIGGGLALLVVLIGGSIRGQEVVDKTVATVSDGARTQLITYSDILWQLALQPQSQLSPPRTVEMNQALQTLINQRIFAIEAERLPRTAPTEKEISAKIGEILSYFPSGAAFEARLKQVGFDSVKDDGFERLVARRISIDKYVAFRFGSFVVVTSEEEAAYYQDIFVPDFRRRSPGILTPTLDEKRAEIHETLVRQKVATAIERFLDDAKRRLNIEILIEV